MPFTLFSCTLLSICSSFLHSPQPAITVSFQQPNYTVTEDAGSVEVCLIIDSGGVETTEVEVDVTPMPSTASEGKEL